MKSNIILLVAFCVIALSLRSQNVDSLAYAILTTNSQNFNFDLIYSNGKAEDLVKTLSLKVDGNRSDKEKNGSGQYQQFLFRAIEQMEKQGYLLISSNVLRHYYSGAGNFEWFTREFYFRKAPLTKE